MRSRGSDPAARAYIRCFARVLTRLFAGTMLALPSACAKKDFKSEMDKVESWTATTSLAAGRRTAHATNAAVTRQLLQRAGQSYSSSSQALGKLAKSDSERTAAKGALDSLHQGIVHLERVAR